MLTNANLLTNMPRSGGTTTDPATVSNTSDVANSTARLALTYGTGDGEVQVGDLVRQTDTGVVYLLVGDTPSNAAHWHALSGGEPWRILLDPGLAAMTGTWGWFYNANSRWGGYWYLQESGSGGGLSWADAIPGPGTYKLRALHYQAYDSGVGSVFVDNVDTTANLDFAGNNSAVYNVLIESGTFTVSGYGPHDLAVKILDPSDDNNFWRMRPVIFELVRTA